MRNGPIAALVAAALLALTASWAAEEEADTEPSATETVTGETATPAPRERQAQPPRRSPTVSFSPSEEVAADTAVAFPTDI